MVSSPMTLKLEGSSPATRVLLKVTVGNLATSKCPSALRRWLSRASTPVSIEAASSTTSTRALLTSFDSVSTQPSLIAISPRTFDIRWRIVKLTLLWFGSTAHFIAWFPPGFDYLLLQPFTVQPSVEAIYSHAL